ncbi:transposase [Roseospira marina]|uniref:Transposase n=1 Tax=Roseospira marina TaxID=140057 RepID=A0A5M6IG62_9PROT|nr:transposase [Roseospira marina]MBB4312554.1 transposase [Roseospira marina]MBB5085430.1 transposase [Roseospira marina]
MAGQLGFFDLEDRYAPLSKAGDPLEKLAAVVDFELFRYRLVKALKRSDGARGCRPPYDPTLMFKILILQALYGLSDEQAEFQIWDRLTFMRFLGLGPGEAVPDATTIWLFREHLTQAGAIKTLFGRFDALLADKGYLAMSGQILDASLIQARHPANAWTTARRRRSSKAKPRPRSGRTNPARQRRRTWMKCAKDPGRYR